MMQRVVCRRLGSLSDLEVEEAPIPSPQKDEVLVEVRAAGINYVDALVVQGKHQLKPSLPMTPGSELAGVVVACGPGVSDLQPGDRVFGMCMAGGFATHAVVRRRALRLMPDSLTFGQAATFVHSYGTAWFALTRSTQVGPGDWVVVLGAAGGVGLAAVDVARHLGARVIAAASTDEKLALAAHRGAEATVNYERDDLKVAVREHTGGGAAVIVDPVGGKYAEPALRSLAPEGRFLVVGFAAGSIPAVRLNLVLLGNRRVIGVEWGSWAASHRAENDAMLDELVQATADGRLSPVEPQGCSLRAAAQALADLESRRVAGKLVLIPGDI